MLSGQEMLEATTAVCREVASGLDAKEQASQAWEASLTEIVEKFEDVSGTFFFKTMPSIPVTKACQRAAEELLALGGEKRWVEFGPALEQLIQSAQNVIENAGMKGTTLT
jgi:hypothetical protein